ncbi:hypothetical protein B0J14DRAFT_159390 [Halenospora varia]|nr:hypothetical protein B0J14DRAFT_159390 [Halenospora varia]
MYSKDSLLQLFDIAGLLPSVSYTKEFINKHKRRVCFRVMERKDENRYELNAVNTALDKILRIIEVDGLPFHPISEPWESSWNPLALGKEWKEPIPGWKESLVKFKHERLERTKEKVEVSAIFEYNNRVSQAMQQVEFKFLKEELRGCQNHSDGLQREIDSRDERLADLQGQRDEFDKEVEYLEGQIEEYKAQLADGCYELRTERDRLQL